MSFEPKITKDANPSRQQIFHFLFSQANTFVRLEYGGELRKYRRRIARNLARRHQHSMLKERNGTTM
jgi:hypothetical protein